MSISFHLRLYRYIELYSVSAKTNLDHLPQLSRRLSLDCASCTKTRGVTFVPPMISCAAGAECKHCLSLRDSISRGDKLGTGCRRDERERGSWMKNLLQRRWLAKGRWWWTSEGRVNGSTVCQMVWRCRRYADPVPLLFHNNGSSRSLVKRSNIVDDNCHETDLWQTMVFYENTRCYLTLGLLPRDFYK